ncbi:MAG: hypothetical protein GKS06_06115 [Acidobacteria bacterium]|nr:hypothetical protein [Acidobacteriota bacterium]
MTDDQEARILREYITGGLDEQSATDFEHRLLTDDNFADSLDLGETELLEAWVGGELDEELAARVADLVATSPRLQARADTAFGLANRRGPEAAFVVPTEESAAVPAGRSKLVLGLTAALLITLVALLYQLRAASDRKALESRLQQLESELAQIRSDEIDLRRELARARAEQRIPDQQ